MLQTIKKRSIAALLMLFALTMLFVNCQFDDKESFHIKNHNHSTYKVQKLKKEQYVKNSKLVNRLNKFESKFAKKSNSKIVSANDNSFSIDTDYSFYIEKENGKHSYTFLINRENSPFLLENLILSSHDSLGYEVYIAQYDITLSEYEQIKNGQNPNLLSKINLIKVENVINIENIFNRSTGFPTQGLCGVWVTIPGNTCPDPVAQHKYGEYCTHVNDGSITLYPDITIYEWQECGYDSSGGGSGGSSGGSTGGSTGGGSDGSDGSTTDNPTGQDKDDSVITTPILSTHTIEGRLLSFITEEQANYYFNFLDNSTQTQILNYVDQNTNSKGLVNTEAKEFVKELIDTSIQLEINIVDIWFNDYENFRNQMSNSERAIFDSILPNRQMWYMASAYKAKTKAEELFHIGLHNGKGDAYRHALWNGLSSLFIGTVLTEQLTSAHENKPPTYTYNYKENIMDLNNNHQGRIVSTYSNFLNIYDNISNHLQIGMLDYLNNLNPINNQATSNSEIIPTNQ
jgi:uncharacterized membrane protein YgcG